MGRSSTSHDVARLAGVSQPTVSRALSGAAGISERTRRRVQEAAAALGYVPSERGRTLSTRRTRRIGIVSADLMNPFYPELVEPLRRELQARGYRAVLIPELDDSDAALRSLADGALDGVVFTTAQLGATLPLRLQQLGVPAVLVNRELESRTLDAAVIDNVRGGALVATLMADLGHRRIGAVFGPDSASTSQQRERGLRDELAGRDIVIAPRLVRRGPFTFEAGHAATLELLALPEPPTAIFYANDVLAVGGLNALHARGLSPGTDMTVVGFDDIAMAGWDMFQLTTVHSDCGALARTAVALVTNRVEQVGQESQRVVLQPAVVRRGTHGPAH